MRSKTLIPVGLVLLAAGCAAPEHLRKDFGYSYRNNVAVQTFDPAAEQRERAQAAGDGQKLEQALNDYRKGRPEATRDRLIISTGNR